MRCSIGSCSQIHLFQTRMEVLFAEEREYEFEETTRSDEVISPGGIKKQLMLIRMKEREEEKATIKFLRTPPKPKGEKYALSFKFQNYVGNCLSGEAQDKIFNLFEGTTDVKLGRLRPNDKQNDKTKYRYNGWINFFSVGDCHRAMEAIRNNEQKMNGIQIVKIGKVRELYASFQKRRKSRRECNLRVAITAMEPNNWSEWLNFQRNQRRMTNPLSSRTQVFRFDQKFVSLF